MKTATAAGAVLLNMETKELMVAQRKDRHSSRLAARDGCTIRASRPPTTTARRPTDSSSATARARSSSIADTLQYHPTGAAFPAQIYGALVTEKVRSVGAMLINCRG